MRSEKELRKKIKDGFFSTNKKGAHSKLILCEINAVADTVLKWVFEENPKITIFEGESRYSVAELRKVFKYCFEHRIFYPNEPIGDDNSYIAGGKEMLLILKDEARVEEILE